MENIAKLYPQRTAGRLMVSQVPVIGVGLTVAEVEKLLISETKNFVSINYIYVVDSQRHLVGVLSVKEVFRSPKNSLVKDLMVAQVVSVRAHTDQERAALLALKHNIKEMPVVDKEENFLGIVSSDEIMRILDSEAVENVLRMGGILGNLGLDNVFSLSIGKLLKHRLPWLFFGLLGGLVAAGIVNSYEETLQRNIILAAFIPLIVYMASAVGTQSLAFIVRDIAINPKLNFAKYFFKNVLVTGLISFFVSIGLYFASLFIFHESLVSYTLGVALFLASLSSLFTGLVVPYLFSKLHVDPANASGPIATIIQDIISISIYFGVALWLL